MKKTILLLTIAIVLVFGVGVATAEDVKQVLFHPKTIDVVQVEGWQFFYTDKDGKRTHIDWKPEEEPYVYQDRIYVHIGFAVKYLGLGAAYNEATETIDFYDRTVVPLGSTYAENQNPTPSSSPTASPAVSPAASQ